MTLKQMFETLWSYRHLISVRLYFALGGSTLITLFTSIAAFIYFGLISETQQAVNEQSVPQLTTAFVISNESGALVAAMPRLTSAQDLAEFESISADIQETVETFEAEIEKLTGDQMGTEQRSELSNLGRVIHGNIKQVHNLVAMRFSLKERGNELLSELDEIQLSLDQILTPALDNQLFYLLTGFSTISEARVSLSDALTEEELEKYRYYLELGEIKTECTRILTSLFTLSNSDLIEPLLEQFEANVSTVYRRRQVFPEDKNIVGANALFEDIFALGTGNRNAFQIRNDTLDLQAAEQALVAENRTMVAQLGQVVERIVQDATIKTLAATEQSSATIAEGRNLLIFVNFISITGAGILAWLYVGRMIISRIDRLSRRMRSMAEGDLEVELDIDGQDEVAEMAAALEIFRKHALEVQRLNLVEKLANELKDKNEQLEFANEEIKRAQDQIVMREKLAALGQLTAGVAHEIKNPLNFVMNFSESSQELLVEMVEELKSEGESDEEYVQEIFDDLEANLKRIYSHGERAANIVRDMLAMGGESNERSDTNINALLSEYVQLAFHSARAADPDFQLTITEELDENTGTILGAQQDLSRLFLNLFINACYAINERRRVLLAEGSPYDPELLIKTSKIGFNVEVRIRDNGTGIPDEVVEKIFNPFFTTKPTDEGTGLGLALSSDIVRAHGGSIRVETEKDKFSEFIIVFPIDGTPTV